MEITQAQLDSVRADAEIIENLARQLETLPIHIGVPAVRAERVALLEALHRRAESVQMMCNRIERLFDEGLEAQYREYIDRHPELERSEKDAGF